MIRRSGENIAAGEVEEVLATHPGIRLAAVAGVPDELRGEEVKAWYVPGSTDVRPADLAAFCREHLAAFKVPRFWQPAEDLPRTDSERVAKPRLSELTGPVFDLTTGAWTSTAPDGLGTREACRTAGNGNRSFGQVSCTDEDHLVMGGLDGSQDHGHAGR
jgi:AMP-binding enzyme C-terminal domain